MELAIADQPQLDATPSRSAVDPRARGSIGAKSVFMPLLFPEAGGHQQADRLTRHRLARAKRDGVDINAQMVDHRLLRGTAQLQQATAESAAFNQKPVAQSEQALVPPAPSRQPRDRGGIIAVERGY